MTFPKIAFSLFILVSALLVGYFSLDLLRDSRMKSDEELKTMFWKHRDLFTQLERLFMNDPTLLYASSSTFHRYDGRGVDTVPPDEYRSILKRTGILFGIRDGVLDLQYFAFPTNEIPLDASTDSAEWRYERKGYALILAGDRSSIELLGTGRTYGNVEFKQLDHNWYTYHGINVSKPE